MKERKEPTPTSELNLPVQIKLDSIEKVLNQQVKDGQVLYQETIFKAGVPQEWVHVGLQKWLKSGIEIAVSKADTIRLSVINQELYIKFPLTSTMALTYALQVNPLETTAELVSVAKIKLWINECWELCAKAENVGHEWRKRPAFKVMGLAISQLSIIEDDIAENLAKWVGRVDELLKQAVPLANIAEQVWQRVQQPMPVLEKPPIWLNVAPSNLQISDIQYFKKHVQVAVHAKAGLQVSGQQQKVVNSLPLPPFETYTAADETTTIWGNAYLTYAQATAVLSQSLKGYTFKKGWTSIHIKDIELYPEKERLVIKVKLRGSLKGNLFLKGKAVYLPKQQKIELQNFDFELKTKNFLAKVANLVLHEQIAEKMKEQFEQSIQKELKNLPQTIDNYLYLHRLNKHLLLNGKLQHYELTDIQFNKKYIELAINLKSKVNIELEL